MRAKQVLVLAVFVSVMAGCGIPEDDNARVVTPPPGPYQALATPAPGGTDVGPAVETLYFIEDGAIVPVQRRTGQERSPEEVVRDLLAGPTEAERAAGVGSALPGGAVVDRVDVDKGIAVVSLGGTGLGGSGRNDQVLAFGQIVCTLDARPDIIGVAFVHEGEPIGVPSGGGLVTKGTLTTADYESLLAGP